MRSGSTSQARRVRRPRKTPVTQHQDHGAAGGLEVVHLLLHAGLDGARIDFDGGAVEQPRDEPPVARPGGVARHDLLFGHAVEDADVAPRHVLGQMGVEDRDEIGPGRLADGDGAE